MSFTSIAVVALMTLTASYAVDSQASPAVPPLTYADVGGDRSGEREIGGVGVSERRGRGSGGGSGLRINDIGRRKGDKERRADARETHYQPSRTVVPDVANGALTADCRANPPLFRTLTEGLRHPASHIRGPASSTRPGWREPKLYRCVVCLPVLSNPNVGVWLINGIC